MAKLWVIFGRNNSTQVSTETCSDVDDFLKACKKKLTHLLGSYDSAQLSLSTTAGRTPLQPDASLSQITDNTAKTPLIITVNPLPNLLPLTPRKMARLEAIKKYMFYIFNPSTEQRGCVTAYSKRRLATCTNLVDKDLFQDGAQKVTIYSLLDNIPYEAKVIKVDRVNDLILLEAEEDVCDIPPRRASPEEGEEYFQLGLSPPLQDSTISVSRGVFITREFDFGAKYHYGSVGSNTGDSGGGCFSETQNLLFGIKSGVDTIPLSDNTTLNELASRYHSISHIIPSVFFD